MSGRFTGRVSAEHAITLEAWRRNRANVPDVPPPVSGTPDWAVVERSREEWIADAACRGMGPTLFYPDDTQGSNKQVQRALAVCAGCAVRRECDAYAESLPQTLSRWGVWGGRSSRNRRLHRSETSPHLCRICGAEFRPSFGFAYWCSDACKRAAGARWR